VTAAAGQVRRQPSTRGGIGDGGGILRNTADVAIAVGSSTLGLAIMAVNVVDSTSVLRRLRSATGRLRGRLQR
jgi:hypothetical protein